MKIIFMGTPEFAVPSLEALIQQYEVCAVFTQPDKPKGRGKKLAMSPIKEIALKYGIDVYQPLQLRKDTKLIETMKSLKPDFIVVVAYGQILTKEVLDIPKYKCINVHGSLLPKYRGAAPINWAIMNGESTTGNTTMVMDVGLDTGDILLKDEIPIEDNMSAGELHDILMDRGANLLIHTIEKIINNEIIPIKQGENTNMYASMLDKKMAIIDWSKPCRDVHNFIRGLNPWPLAYTYYKGEVMKIHKSIALEDSSYDEPGKIINVDKDCIIVSCGLGAIKIKKIQFPGKKAMEISEYIKGNKIEKGVVLDKNRTNDVI